MMSIANISRRDFIKVTSTAGAGLVLGVYLYSNRKHGSLASGESGLFAPNAWLGIDTSGTVTIVVAKSEMGQGVRTSLPMIVADELEADWTKVRIEQASAHPTKYGSQGTGGSSSVRRSYEMLRKAGAAAREMLIAATAKQWDVDQSTCFAQNGAVIHKPSGKKLEYGNLVEAAAALPIPENPRLKDPKGFRLIGKRMPRLDTPQKVEGTAVYGIDVKLPGMLYVTIARPPVFGAKLVRFDATKARTIGGVKEIVRADDILSVIATSTWAAIQGREALSVTWDEGGYANQNSEAIWKLFEESARLDGTVERNDGDARAAFANASRKVEAIYIAPFVAHVTMEPMNCTAHVQNNRCEIWAPSQTPQDAQSEASKILNVPVENVKVNVTLMGGGFGRRLETDYVVEAVKVSKAINAPVKVVWTREDDMRHDFYRPATYNVLRAGLDKDGMPVAWIHRIVGADEKGLVIGGSTPPYDLPNVYIDSHIKETGVPIGAWRSVGHSQNGFVVECFIDELAHAANQDPFEYRRALLSKSPRLKQALEVAATKADWAKPLPKGFGRGIACVQGFGSSVAQVAEVSVAADSKVRVHRVVCAIDCGPVVNPDTIEAQMESGIAYGLTAAVGEEITIERGMVKQSNFDDYPMLRIDEMPNIEVHIVPSSEAMGGVGEPGVPPIAPAVANAVFAATGKRIRKLPIRLNA